MRRWWWGLAVGAVAAGAVLVGTRFGIGVSTDSVTYLAEARQLRAGHGLTVPAGLLEIYADVDPERDPLPSAHFPPLYPAVLAATGLGSVGWLNASLLAVTAGLVALMVHWGTGSRPLAGVAAGMVALSPAVLDVHAMAWSEPLFIALAMGALAALGRQQGPQLVVAALCAGLAWLTRYAGLAVILTGVAVLAGRGWRRVAAFLAVSATPMAVYLVAMAAVGAHGGYTWAPHLPTAAVLSEAWEAVRRWVVPVERWTVLQAAAVLVMALAVAVVVAVRRGPPRSSSGQVVRVAATFLGGYAVVLLGSVSVFEEDVPLDGRILAPAYPVAVVLLATLRPDRVVLPVLAASTVVAGGAAIEAGLPTDLGFNAPVWTESEGLQETAGLPAALPIYSNFPEAISYRTGREARLLPPDARRVAEEVRAGRAAVVVFTRMRRDGLPGPDQLTAAIGFAPRAYVLDAAVYAGPA